MHLIAQTKTVLWSLVGLGRRQDMAQVHTRGNPLVLVLIAFVAVLVFLATLAAVAHCAVQAA